MDEPYTLGIKSLAGNSSEFYSCRYRSEKWIAKTDGHRKLVSLMVQARCYASPLIALAPYTHSSPYEHCTCGIYAAHHFGPFITHFLNQGDFPINCLVLVQSYGKVLVGEYAWRAEKARVVGIVGVLSQKKHWELYPKPLSRKGMAFQYGYVTDDNYESVSLENASTISRLIDDSETTSLLDCVDVPHISPKDAQAKINARLKELAPKVDDYWKA